MTLAEEIEAKAEIESILKIVIGPFGWHDEDPSDRIVPTNRKNIPISWEEAKPLLGYDYDRGYGGQDCHSIFAWTKNYILFVHEYDGATSINRIPRNPIKCIPEADGF